MLKICITNLSVETIQNLGSLNIGKTIMSHNQASTAFIPPPPPSFPQNETGAVPGQVPVTPAEVTPGEVGASVHGQIPVAPTVVSQSQVSAGIGGGLGSVGNIGRG